MFPLYDESSPALKLFSATFILILINLSIFLYLFLNLYLESAIWKFGLIPNQILEGQNIFSLLTSMFLHFNFYHVIISMWFLLIFGNKLENTLGKGNFILFYFFGGIIAGLTHAFFVPWQYVNFPVVGSMGAVATVLGGYLVLFPENNINTWVVWWRPPYSIPAFLFSFLYLLLVSVDVMILGVSLFDHITSITGFIVGIITMLFFQKKIEKRQSENIIVFD